MPLMVFGSLPTKKKVGGYAQWAHETGLFASGISLVCFTRFGCEYLTEHIGIILYSLGLLFKSATGFFY